METESINNVLDMLRKCRGYDFSSDICMYCPYNAEYTGEGECRDCLENEAANIIEGLLQELDNLDGQDDTGEAEKNHAVKLAEGVVELTKEASYWRGYADALKYTISRFGNTTGDEEATADE